MCHGELLKDIQNNLMFWIEQVRRLDNERINQLSPQHANVLRAVDIGVRCKSSRLQAADLALRLSPWVERERHEKDWIPIIQRLTQTYEIISAPPIHTNLLLYLGTLFRLNGQIENAIDTHFQALNCLTLDSEKIIIAEIHFNLSENYRRKHQLSKAIKHAQIAKTQLLNDKKEPLFAKTLNTLGLLYLDKGNLEQAKEHFQIALTKERQFKDPTRISRVLNNLALTTKRLEQFNLALNYYAQSLNFLKDTTNVVDQVTTYINQGSLFFQSKNLSSAEESFQYAKNLLTQNKGLFFFEAMVEMNLGKVAQANEQFSQAILFLESSEALWQEIDEPIYLGNTRGALAEIYYQQGEFKKAIKYYTDAIKDLARFPDHAWAKKLNNAFVNAKAKIDLKE